MNESRRFFCQLLTYIGLGGPAEMYVASAGLLNRTRHDSGSGSVHDNVLRVGGQDHLTQEAIEALQLFRQFRIGGLCYAYQNFWPALTALGGIQAVDRACKLPTVISSFKEAKVGHRLAVFPAIARLHALTTVNSDEQRAWQEEVATVYETAIQPIQGVGNKEVLEIVWQSAIGALIRSETNWKWLYPGHRLIRGAVDVCEQFLNEHPVLFHAAVGAWQFLLSYNMAVADRANNSSELHYVRAQIGRILAHGRARSSYWFAGLAGLYAERRGLEQAVPQMAEVIIGQRRNDIVPQEIIDYFLRESLHHSYILGDLRRSNANTPYLSPERLAGIDRFSLTILNNYGFSVGDWQRLSRTLATASDIYGGMTNDEMATWNELIPTPTAASALSDWQKWELRDAPQARAWSQMYPFRKYSEEAVASMVLGGDLTEQNMKTFLQEVRSKGDITSALLAPGALATRRLIARDLEQPEESLSLFTSSDQLPVESREAQVRDIRKFWDDEVEPQLRLVVSVPADYVSGDLAKVALSGSVNLDRQPESSETLGVSEEEARGISVGTPHLKEADVTIQSHYTPADEARRKRNRERAEAHYERRRKHLEADHYGKYVVLSADGDDYLVGDDLFQAMAAFCQKFGTEPSIARKIGELENVGYGSIGFFG